MAAETQQPEQTQVATVFDLFLDHTQRHNSQRTYACYHDFLQDFAATAIRRRHAFMVTDHSFKSAT